MLSGGPVDLSSSGNLLLRRLSQSDRRTLLPHLHHVAMDKGATLLKAADRIDTIYFPETGLLAIEEGTGQSHVEIAVIGREGMLGWPALLGSDVNMQDAIVQGEGGRAFSIDLELLLAACRASMTLWATLLDFVQQVMNQMARTIATQIESTLEQRISRWLLMRHDRLAGDHVIVRHDQIAGALNARRASITDRLQILEGRGLIRCRRGRVIVRDRAALELSAGGAYGEADFAHQGTTGRSARPAIRRLALAR